MLSDWAVELGPNDEALDLPWNAPKGGPQYYDLKHHPELLQEIPETHTLPELANFLAAINAAHSPFETAKCDAWLTTEMTIEDEIFATSLKFGGYIDFLFSDLKLQSSFPNYERFAKRITRTLQSAPAIPASTEFLIRRCFFRREQEIPEIIADGFYITLYIFGFAADETTARQYWAAALKRIEDALLQTPLD